MLNTYSSIFSLHKNVSDFFLQSIKANSLSHAYLLYGKKGLGKFNFAKELAKVILSCPASNLANISSLQSEKGQDINLVENNSHANLIVLQKEEKKKNITVEQVRELSSFLNKTSYTSNKYKIVIIESIDDLSINASNALLKSLEEPNKLTLFFIICHNIASVLPTISSRCIKQQFYALNNKQLTSYVSSQELSQDFTNNLETIINLSEGSLFLLKKCIRDEEFYKLLIFTVTTLKNIKTIRAFEFINQVSSVKTITAEDFLILLDVAMLYIKNKSYKEQSIASLIAYYKKEGLTYNVSLKDMLINLFIQIKLLNINS